MDGIVIDPRLCMNSPADMPGSPKAKGRIDKTWCWFIYNGNFFAKACLVGKPFVYIQHDVIGSRLVVGITRGEYSVDDGAEELLQGGKLNRVREELYWLGT